MYESIVFDNKAQVIHKDDKGNLSVVCTIPTYYSNDSEISKLIAKLLQENSKKYQVKFEI